MNVSLRDFHGFINLIRKEFAVEFLAKLLEVCVMRRSLDFYEKSVNSEFAYIS